MKKEKKTDHISTFIGADASIEGTIEFKGSIRVDGRAKGKIISSSGTVVVGEKAFVDAELLANVVLVMGKVVGTIEANERVEIFSQGCVDGDIHTPIISIAPGGIFNGNCVMKASEQVAGEISIFSRKQPAIAEPNDESGATDSDIKFVFAESKSN